MNPSKSFAWPLLIVGAAAGWWWWRQRQANGSPVAGGDVAKGAPDAGIQIGQAGSNIGLTGDQVGTLIERMIEAQQPYDEVRIVGRDGNLVGQVRYKGEGDWLDIASRPWATPWTIAEICGQHGLNCRDN